MNWTPYMYLASNKVRPNTSIKIGKCWKLGIQYWPKTTNCTPRIFANHGSVGLQLTEMYRKEAGLLNPIYLQNHEWLLRFKSKLMLCPCFGPCLTWDLRYGGHLDSITSSKHSLFSLSLLLSINTTSHKVCHDQSHFLLHRKL